MEGKKERQKGEKRKKKEETDARIERLRESKKER